MRLFAAAHRYGAVVACVLFWSGVSDGFGREAQGTRRCCYSLSDRLQHCSSKDCENPKKNIRNNAFCRNRGDSAPRGHRILSTRLYASLNDNNNNNNNGNGNLNKPPRMFGGIPGPSSNSGLPKKSYSVTSWKPGNTLRTATTAGSNNAYLWNMPSSSSAAAAKDETRKNTPKTASDSTGAARDNLFRDDEEELYDEEDSEDDYSLIPTKIPTEDSPTWELGNNFDHFINQCSIQSFLFLLKNLRDPQTLIWLEAFTQPEITASRNRLAIEERKARPFGGSANSKLLSYHGLAAMNTTAFPSWDAYFRQLLDQPVEHQTIESWQAHVPTYDLEINPASLCTRLLSVREQIAREFTKDLSVLATMGGQTLRTYWQGIRDKARDGDNESSPEGRVTGSATLLFLEAAPESDSDYLPSPLRKGNFDLLVLLATQESIHRVLMNAKIVHQDDDLEECPVASMSRSNRNFLSNFYLQRLVSHFTGRQPYGRADQFLQELLLSTPSMIVGSDDDRDDVGEADDAAACLVDPTRIAEQILEMRQAVAREWRARAERAPELHMDLKRLQLDRLMDSYSNDSDEAPFQ